MCMGSHIWTSSHDQLQVKGKTNCVGTRDRRNPSFSSRESIVSALYYPIDRLVHMSMSQNHFAGASRITRTVYQQLQLTNQMAQIHAIKSILSLHEHHKEK
jgi:hypothetical protein